MANEKKVSSLLKHKRIIIVSLVLIGLFLMILLTYVLTYVNNKPKPFKDDGKVKISNKCDYFTLDVVAEKISFDGTKPQMDLRADMSNVKATLTNVSIQFEVNNYWTSKGNTTSSSTSFNSGNKITPTTTTTYNASTTLNLNIVYPIKVMPLVRVKHPTIFAKVTYERKLPDSMNGEGGKVNEVVYYRFTYSDYCTNDTTFN